MINIYIIIHTEADRQTDRQTQTQRHRQTDRQTYQFLAATTGCCFSKALLVAKQKKQNLPQFFGHLHSYICVTLAGCAYEFLNSSKTLKRTGHLVPLQVVSPAGASLSSDLFLIISLSSALFSFSSLFSFVSALVSNFWNCSCFACSTALSFSSNSLRSAAVRAPPASRHHTLVRWLLPRCWYLSQSPFALTWARHHRDWTRLLGS